MKLKPRFFTAIFGLVFIPWGFSSDLHSVYSGILSAYVKDGLVNYKALCKDRRLPQYTAQLAETDSDKLDSENSKLAFWINVYNAYTLKIICDHYPVTSINDLHFGGLVIGQLTKRTIWHKEFVIINHKPMSLNHIEHDIIRSKFKEPRIHFALVCAAISCPPLRPEAYEGDKLEDQLNDQARLFLNDSEKNSFDTQKKVAYISKIFDWYAKDFGGSHEKVLLYLAPFLSEETGSAIRSNPRAWTIKYKMYNWGLNEYKPGSR